MATDALHLAMSAQADAASRANDPGRTFSDSLVTVLFGVEPLAAPAQHRHQQLLRNEACEFFIADDVRVLEEIVFSKWRTISHEGRRCVVRPGLRHEFGDVLVNRLNWQRMLAARKSVDHLREV